MQPERWSAPKSGDVVFDEGAGKGVVHPIVVTWCLRKESSFRERWSVPNCGDVVFEEGEQGKVECAQ